MAEPVAHAEHAAHTEHAAPAAPAASAATRHDDISIRRSRLSVRTRVLASVLLMSALGMAVAGATSFVIQERRLDARVTAALQQEVEEFRALASQGVDPATGRRFTSVEQLLRVALQRNVPEQNETYLTLLEEVPLQFDGGDRPIELENEPEVFEAVAAVPPGSPVAIQDVDTAAGRARLAVVPVGIAGQGGSGTYVIAYALDLERGQLLDLMRTYALVALGSLLLVGVVGWVVAGRLLRPLRLLREATQRINETDLSERIPVRGADDVSELSRTYNAMLDRLQEAFQAQRELIDDAGHELRTPVTIVRGHLELLDPADPRDVADTRALLIDEMDRMSRLVEDLIVLANARHPDFVRPSTVHLATFTDDVLDKARGLGDRDWHVESRADADITADPQRLTQAALQLAGNAVKFSRPGSRIGIGSAVDGGTARIWVSDTGPGIEPDDLDRVFDRFGRAETGRGVEGSGLGLAIVSAIVEAHGGRVEVDSQPGVGSMFTIVLPAAQEHTPDGDTRTQAADVRPTRALKEGSP